MRDELLEHEREKIQADAFGFASVTVAAQALNGEQLHRCPTVGRVPLIAARVVARLQAARALEAPEIRHDPRRLALCGQANPERIEGRDEMITTHLAAAKVVIEVQPLALVPHQTVD